MYKMEFNSIRTMLLMMIVTLYSAVAMGVDLTNGNYRLVNLRTQLPITENLTTSALNCKTLGGDNDFSQIWSVEVSGNTVAIKNILSNRYIQLTNRTNQAFVTAANKVFLPIGKNGDTYYIGTAPNFLMHCPAGNNILAWNGITGESNNWSFEAVNVDQNALAAAKDAYNNGVVINANQSEYTEKLKKFFSDYACTELNDTYKNASEADITRDMQAEGLPVSLQDIVLKVRRGVWADREKEYRIHDYEPYSEPIAWSGKLNIYRYSFMSNPVGVSLNKGDNLYVFVDEAIPANSTLYVTYMTGENWISSRDGGTNGVKLKQGVNVLSCDADNAMVYMLYTVDTADRQRTIASFPKIKIHVEGGEVYGYWDRKRHKDADFAELLESGKSPMFQIKGDRILLNIDRETLKKVSQGKVEKSIAWYDNMVRWEQEVMGICKDVYDGNRYDETSVEKNIKGGEDIYPTYYNNYMYMNSGSQGGMFAYWYYINYQKEYLGSVWPDTNSTWDTWGPAHELGHVNQLAINQVSCTEASNNLFSNVVCYMTGRIMSRGLDVEYNAEDFVAKKPYMLRSISSKLRMYFQLYLYYHVARNKPDFYPTLFKLLRESPMKKGIQTNGADETLHFVEMCCKAANEDLTEFFEAWGMFEPLDNVYCNDYYEYNVTTKQEDIDATKQRIKDTYSTKNSAILFIEDRVEQYERADGVEGMRAAHDSQSGIGQCGDLGQFTQYEKGKATPANYIYSVIDNKVKMIGSGGVGFKVYDKDGNLITFSNNKEFTLPAGTDTESITVVAMNGDNTEMADVQSVENGGTIDQKKTMLAELLNEANDILNHQDETATKVGFYKPSELTVLSKLVADAENATDENISELIKTMKDEVSRIINDSDATYAIGQGCYYTITNVRYNRLSSVNNNGGIVNVADQTPSFDKRWTFVAADASKPNLYYIKNRNTGKYVASISQSAQARVTAENEADALKFFITPLGNGQYGIQSVDLGTFNNMHCDQAYNTVGWKCENTTSFWLLTLVETESEVALNDNLVDMMAKTDELVNSVCNYTDKVVLQTTAPNANGYLSTNAQSKAEGDISGLIDGKTSTYFHSSYDGTVYEDHYLQVDFGVGQGMNEFILEYTTRNTGANFVNKPTEIKVMGANSLDSEFELLTTLTSNDANPLPSNRNTVESYKSDELNGKGYRYLRFVVTKTNDGNQRAGKVFFTMSEFSLNYPSYSITKFDGYGALKNEVILNAINEYNKAQSAYNNFSNTYDDRHLALISLSDAYEKLKNAIDIATSCIEILNDKNGSDVYYDLQGRRVLNPTNGIYINDGKKVIIRNK